MPRKLKGQSRKALIMAICFGCLHVGQPVASAANDIPESSVKAAFVYNFAKFVNWAHLPTAQNEIVLGIIGDRPLNGELWALAGRKVGVRRIRVVRVENGKHLKCDLVYVGDKIPANDPRIKDQLGNDRVLTVSDAKGFAKRGGIIELYRAGTKVRFEIRNDAAKKAGVEISSKLLRLAVPRPGSRED